MDILALRFVVVELLQGHVESMFTKFLDDVSAKSNLAEHWLCNLIKPVLLMMFDVRAEREGEFALHLDICKRMLLYFFAASHWNYSRDGTAHVQMMENIPGNVLNPLMKGKHIVRLQDRLWNAIWRDMAIESTYMRMGKGPSGLIGVTTQERTVKFGQMAIICAKNFYQRSTLWGTVTMWTELNTKRKEMKRSRRTNWIENGYRTPWKNVFILFQLTHIKT